MHYADYCHRHRVWFHAEDALSFIEHYNCERAFIQDPPMSAVERHELEEQGAVMFSNASTPQELALANDVLHEVEFQRRLASAIENGEPPPLRVPRPVRLP